MRYTNPIITGFYPDPSICKGEGMYYMVCSSFDYFPGVPLFESSDLINWKQIGHVLDRESQLPLKGAGTNGGIYAPSIRYYKGRFYMITTNVSGCGNFFVWTDDIHGAWSEPVEIDRNGIDPSLFFEDDKVYFTGNYTTEEGILTVRAFEIDINTGKRISEQKNIWTGTGGRYLEGPHLYKIGDWYYLLAAEGGTEYGHMIVYARGKSPFGPFESYPGNPVLTNRNKGDYQLQGVGHGDLVCDNSGNWWMVHLAFRQQDRWTQYHLLGREVCLVPVTFDEEGWFFAGIQGMTMLEIETDRIPDTVVQKKVREYDFSNTSWDREWCYLRNPKKENYEFGEDFLKMRATTITLDDEQESPSFLAIRQKELEGELEVCVHPIEGEAGVTIFMDSHHHYDFAVEQSEGGLRLIKRRTIGDMQYIQENISLETTEAVKLHITASAYSYSFWAEAGGKRYSLGTALSRYLSSEVAGGFTGVMFALYAQQKKAEEEWAEFTGFSLLYCDKMV